MTAGMSRVVLGQGLCDRYMAPLPTQNHPWLGTAPLDGGNLNVVLARNDGHAFRITEWALELDR